MITEQQVQWAGPSIDQLRAALQYDPDTGSIVWKAQFGKSVVGAEAGTFHTRGYRQIKFKGRIMKAHRIAWALHYGEWPSKGIDHIDGNPSNNRIENLRNVEQSENVKNMKRPVHNKTGVVGVTKCPGKKPWLATIQVNGKTKNLGYYSDFDEAVAARKAANERYGFHQNHGQR